MNFPGISVSFKGALVAFSGFLKRSWGDPGGFMSFPRVSIGFYWYPRVFRKVLGGSKGVPGMFQGVSEVFRCVLYGFRNVPGGFMGCQGCFRRHIPDTLKT